MLTLSLDFFLIKCQYSEFTEIIPSFGLYWNKNLVSTVWKKQQHAWSK